jgi:hypothetical protein
VAVEVAVARKARRHRSAVALPGSARQADLDELAAALAGLVASYAERAGRAARTAAVLEEALRLTADAARDERSAAAAVAAIRQALAESRSAAMVVVAERDALAWVQSSVSALAQDFTAPRTAAAAPRPHGDARGYDLRPDPLACRTPGDLVAALRGFRCVGGRSVVPRDGGPQRAAGGRFHVVRRARQGRTPPARGRPCRHRGLRRARGGRPAVRHGVAAHPVRELH